MNSIFHILKNETYDSACLKLAIMDHMDLATIIINERYNRFLLPYVDFKAYEFPLQREIPNGKDYGKRIPYFGWNWEYLNFYDQQISIGFSDCGYRGFITENKWNHYERRLNDNEFSKLILLIDNAMNVSDNGDDLENLHYARIQAIEEIHPWMQQLAK